MPDISATNIFWKYFESVGIDPAPIYQKAGINPELLLKDSARISVEHVNNLWQQADDVLTDPCFAVKMVKLWHPSMMGALGYAWLASSSLQSAFKRIERYNHVVSEDLGVQVTTTPQGLQIKAGL